MRFTDDRKYENYEEYENRMNTTKKELSPAEVMRATIIAVKDTIGALATDEVVTSICGFVVDELFKEEE